MLFTTMFIDVTCFCSLEVYLVSMCGFRVFDSNVLYLDIIKI